MPFDLVPNDEKHENRYCDIGRNKFPDVERSLDKRSHAVKDDQKDAGEKSPSGLKPLTVGFVRVLGVVAIVARGLCFGRVAVELCLLKTTSVLAANYHMGHFMIANLRLEE